MSVQFSEKAETVIQDLLTRYPTKQAALLPVLHLAEKEFGWISEPVMELVAKRLEVSAAHVYGVVTFYTMYQTTPPAKFHLQLCRTLPCMMMGSESLLEHLKKSLKIEEGETTPDGRYKLSTVECLASCGTAPAIRINEEYRENLTIEKLDWILEELDGVE